MSQKSVLSESDLVAAAEELGVPVAVIKAVCEVEAPRGGFQANGEPVILFERHLFSRYTHGKWDASQPDISNPKPGGYGASISQHTRLARAAKLDRQAALKAASWGKFQILGVNHKQAGHKTLQSFINAMYESEAAQLDAFVAFIKADKRLLDALRERDWAAFARVYNGPNYAINRYDEKLAAAYAKHRDH